MMVVEGWDGDFRTRGGGARRRGQGRGSAGDHTVDGHRVEDGATLPPATASKPDGATYGISDTW